ncbi:hypothetical protein G7Y89_g15019 [Cudoniella acicularis]|uniref:Uncharacterized protein n=1 Tax=Cudoniella acicularis TaxID=354080 RepID=A0A8H4QWA1_9HELO|nr:hypothetical protein G7Y89_g15019 [Cudoniella acicularis]
MGLGVWWFVPETKGRTLEGMDAIFGCAYAGQGERGAGNGGGVVVRGNGGEKDVVVSRKGVVSEGEKINHNQEKEENIQERGVAADGMDVGVGGVKVEGSQLQNRDIDGIFKAED